MKKLLVAATLFVSMSCTAQKTPAAVQAAFTKTFPGITAKWDTEDGNYEANFKKDGKTMSATFDSKGGWLETETDIAISELPAAVSTYIKANYSGMKIKEAAMLKTPGGDMYEAEVNGKDLMFDMNGNFMKEAED